MTTSQTIDGVLISVIASEMNRLGYGLHESHAASILCAIQKAQPQGEPVAWMLYGSVGGSSLDFQRADLLETQNRHGGCLVPLYAEQAAPVSPDRPTHANPPPGTEPSGTHHDNDGLDEMRKPACCGSCPAGRVIQKESK